MVTFFQVGVDFDFFFAESFDQTSEIMAFVICSGFKVLNSPDDVGSSAARAMMI